MEASKIIIIDKTKPPSPIYVRQPIPTFRTDYEKQKYYVENKKRCLEGYAGLPGTLYDYLQNQYLKHRIVPPGHDAIEPPIPRAASLWMHQEFDRTRRAKKAQGVIKARNVGLSTEGGALANYFSKYYPGSNSLITSKDQDGISIMFMEKIYAPYQHLHKDLRPDELSRNATKQRCYLRLGVSHIGIDGNEQYSESQISLRETSEKPKSPTNFSGQGAIYGYVDEAPLHPRREELFNSFVECFRNPFTKELDGFILWGGTVEAVMTNEAVSELQTMINNKDLWDCNIYFVPFWHGMFLTNGHPDEKKAYEWWNREYEKVEKDSAKSRAFKMNNPRTIEDIFESVKGGRWEDETAEVLALQKTAVLNADVPCPKYNITLMGGEVVAKQNNSGVFWQLEAPKVHCTYGIGIDGVATGTETGSMSGSKMASTIIKITDPQGDPYMPVNIYFDKPSTVEAGYRRILAQMIYYNQFGGLLWISPEANQATIDHFASFLLREANMFYKLLVKRKDLSGKGWADTSKIGQYRTDGIIDFQYRQANIFIRKYFHSLQMMPLIDQMLLPKGANADILDAWLQFFTAMPEYDKVIKPPPPPRKRIVRTVVNVGGKNQYKDVEV